MLTSIIDSMGGHQLTQVLLFAIACATITTNVAIFKLARNRR